MRNRKWFFRFAGIFIVLVFLFSLISPLSLKSIKNEAAVTLLKPNGGETIDGGSNFSIEWTTKNTGGNIKIFLSTNGGANYSEIIDCIANPLVVKGGNPKYTWQVPNIEVPMAKIRIVHLSACAGKIIQAYGSDESDSTFRIRKREGVATIKITSAVGEAEGELAGSVIGGGPYYTTFWRLNDPNKIVKGIEFQYRTKTGEVWGSWKNPTELHKCLNTFFGGTWWMPPNLNDAYCQLRVRGYSNCATKTLICEDISEEFLIKAPTVRVIQPNGGEVLVGGKPYEIKWMTADDLYTKICCVEINYSLDGGSTWKGIIAASANDFSHIWTVPTSINNSQVKIKVIAQYGEWYYLAHDISDENNRIIPDESYNTVSLTQPNPTVDKGIVYFGGEVQKIKWKTTGDQAKIKEFKLYLSKDGGATYPDFIATLDKTKREYSWTVPNIDTDRARVKVKCYLTDGSVLDAYSINNFVISTTRFNRKPIADCGTNKTVNEGVTTTLDASASYDPDGDTLTYKWKMIEDLGYPYTLSSTTAQKPTFSANVSSFSVNFVLELTVSDGVLTSDPVRMTVTVIPAKPQVTNFTPKRAWEGILIKITGSNLAGCEVFVGDTKIGNVPSPLSYDTEHTFSLPASIPHKQVNIKVKNSSGETVVSPALSVYPKPTYCFNWGLKDHNPSKGTLSYPWDVWNDGDYKRTFGAHQVAISIWVCIGIPYWWFGWKCAGYLIEQEILPDPLAAIYYGIAYWYIARNGECFGMSSTSLQFKNGAIRPQDFSPSASKVNQLDLSGKLRERVDFMHGRQVSLESLTYYISSALGTFLDPTGQRLAISAILATIRAGIASGKHGVLSVVDNSSFSGHALVPYLVEDTDANHTRIYVYDPNREVYSNEVTAAAKLADDSDSANNFPPYVEIDKTGASWSWRFKWPDGSNWTGTYLIFFLPYDIVNRDTLPTAWDALLNWVFGSATTEMKDETGRSIGIGADGKLKLEIPNATAIPTTELAGFAAPFGNYKTFIRGKSSGTYKYLHLAGGNSSFAIEEKETSKNTEDSLDIKFKDKNSLLSEVTFNTNDPSMRKYSTSFVKKFKAEKECTKCDVQRVYKILNSSIKNDTTHQMMTSDDFNSLIYINNGPNPITFDIEFQTTMVSEDAKSRLEKGKPLTRKIQGVRIDPYEKMTITPTDWLNLDNTKVDIKEEMLPGHEKKALITVRCNISEAKFKITGPNTFEGEGALFEIKDSPAGEYTINFSNVKGYITPKSQKKTLKVNESIEFEGIYTKITTGTVIELYVGNPTMYVNGAPFEIDPGRGTVPIIIPEWGRTLVPIRAIVEALGGKISWNASLRKVTIEFKDKIIELWIDNPLAKINGKSVYIDEKNKDVKPLIRNDRTMLPLRFVAESLGCEVSWDDIARRVTIIYKE